MRPRVLAAPYLVGLFVLVFLPAVVAAALSLTEYSGVAAPRYAGLENLARLIGDDGFWRAVGNSAVFVGVAVPLRLTVAVAFALLLHRRGRGIGGARTLAYMPTVIPDAAYALLWLWILNPLYGPLALLLGDRGPGWLTEPGWARIGLAIMAAFQIGEAFVVALAARKLISPLLYDAAAVEGASPWFVLSRVTLPLMAPLLGLLALRDLVVSLQSNFVAALLVTEGGPRYATTFLPLYAYQMGFRYFRLGYASAISLATFAITAVLVFVQYLMVRRWRGRVV